MNSFAIIGGDERNRCLARCLRKLGYKVCCCGLGSFEDFSETSFSSICQQGDIFVFPHIPTKNGTELFAPLSPKTIMLDIKAAQALRGKRIYSGRASALAQALALEESEVFGYDKLESFLSQNARLTAEAALMLAIKESPLAICKASCLVIGYGRIGSSLCKMLDDMGAVVTVSELDKLKVQTAAKWGYKLAQPGHLEEIAPQCDIVFNTCVADTLNDSAISKLQKHALVIELASEPGGCDSAACAKYGVKYIKASGLPGKYSPRSAGEIIAQTILNIEEGREWKEKG